MANDLNVRISLYQNTAPANRVDKSDFLRGYNVVGSFRDTVDYISPTLDVYIPNKSDINANYLKIEYSPNNIKYYFIDNITYNQSGVYTINCTIDVLMTYKDGIMSSVAFVERNEHIYNTHYIDKNLVLEAGVDVEDITVTNEIFMNTINITDDDFCYVINGYKVEVKTPKE